MKAHADAYIRHLTNTDICRTDCAMLLSERCAFFHWRTSLSTRIFFSARNDERAVLLGRPKATSARPLAPITAAEAVWPSEAYFSLVPHSEDRNGI